MSYTWSGVNPVRVASVRDSVLFPKSPATAGLIYFRTYWSAPADASHSAVIVVSVVDVTVRPIGVDKSVRCAVTPESALSR